MNETKKLHEYSKYRSRADTFHYIYFQSRSTIIQKTSPFYLNEKKMIFCCVILFKKWGFAGVVLKLFGVV